MTFDMGCVSDIARFFDNKSVAAFWGAFFAFLLVALTDRRRERKKVKHLRAEIEANLAHAKAKLEAVRNNRTLLRERGLVIGAPFMKFNTVLTRQLAAEVLDRLSLDQRRAIDTLCYWMEATDGVLDESRVKANRLASSPPEHEAQQLAIAMLKDFNDSIVNLKTLIEMCESYVAGNIQRIFRTFTRGEFEEP